jgi:hypothetical protein
MIYVSHIVNFAILYSLRYTGPGTHFSLITVNKLYTLLELRIFLDAYYDTILIKYHSTILPATDVLYM